MEKIWKHFLSMATQPGGEMRKTVAEKNMLKQELSRKAGLNLITPEHHLITRCNQIILVFVVLFQEAELQGTPVSQRFSRNAKQQENQSQKMFYTQPTFTLGSIILETQFLSFWVTIAQSISIKLRDLWRRLMQLSWYLANSEDCGLTMNIIKL